MTATSPSQPRHSGGDSDGSSPAKASLSAVKNDASSAIEAFETLPQPEPRVIPLVAESQGRWSPTATEANLAASFNQPHSARGTAQCLLSAICCASVQLTPV